MPPKRKASRAARRPATKRSKKEPSIPSPPASNASKKKLAKPNSTEVDASSASSDGQPYLEQLPDELVLLVLHHVPGCELEQRKTYYNLSLTSRRLNRATNDYLYETFKSNLYPPMKFLRTIIANPELAARVKDLEFHFSLLPESPVDLDDLSPTSSDRRELRESLKRLGIPGKERGAWERQYVEKKLTSLLKIAVLHSPNIRKLTVSNFSMRPVPFTRPRYKDKYVQLLVDAALDKPVGNSPRFEHLHTLNIGMTGMRLREVYDVFGLPSLRTLRLYGVVTDVLESAGNSRIAFSPVTHLSVKDSFITSTALATLIRSCRELTHFELLYNSSYPPLSVAKIEYGRIANALQQHKHSLESLELDDVSDRDFIHDVEYDRGHLNSFQDFPKLRSLGVPFEAFLDTSDHNPDPWSSDSDSDPGSDLGFDSDSDPVPDPPVALSTLLPPTLQSLRLLIFEDEEDSNRCSNSLRHLCRSFKPAFPHLTSIHVKAQAMVYMRHIDFSPLKRRFREQNVDFWVTQDAPTGLDISDWSGSDDETDWDGFEEDEWLHGEFEEDEWPYGQFEEEVLNVLEPMLQQVGNISEALHQTIGDMIGVLPHSPENAQ